MERATGIRTVALICAVMFQSQTLAAQSPASFRAALTPIAPTTYSPSRRDLFPRASAWSSATKMALTDRGTWIPALAAGLIVVGGWDRQISAWALRNPTLFSSSSRAGDMSDDFLTASQVIMLASGLFAKDDGNFLTDRLKREGWEIGGAATTLLLTLAGKAAFRRIRPDESSRSSLPSGHSSMAFASSAASMRNFSDFEMGRGLHIGADIAVETVAAASAWSRVEAGVHYPTDVLLGAALGNAVSVLFYELYDSTRDAPEVSIRGTSTGAEISVRIPFR